MIFLDANIFLRFYLRDDEAKAERCKDLLQAVASGEERAMTSTMVIAEIVWVLERTSRLSRREVADFVISLLGLPHLVLTEKPLVGGSHSLLCGPGHRLDRRLQRGLDGRRRRERHLHL